MVDDNSSRNGIGSSLSAAASPLFLREDEVRRGIELLHFGYTRLMRTLDSRLEAEGLGRAHQRTLYFIARSPNLSVTQLLQRLAITKQSLGRVMKDLDARRLVETQQGRSDRRQKLLRLTDAGYALEAELFAALREKMSAAYRHAGQESVTGFWRVLEGLLPESDRAMIGEMAGDRITRSRP